MNVFDIECLSRESAKAYADSKSSAVPAKLVKTAMLYIAIAIENGRYRCSVPIMGTEDYQRLAETVYTATFRDLLGYDVRRESNWIIISWK